MGCLSQRMACMHAGQELLHRHCSSTPQGTAQAGRRQTPGRWPACAAHCKRPGHRPRSLPPPAAGLTCKLTTLVCVSHSCFTQHPVASSPEHNLCFHLPTTGQLVTKPSPASFIVRLWKPAIGTHAICCSSSSTTCMLACSDGYLCSGGAPEGGCQVLGEAHGEGRHLVLEFLHDRLERQHQVLVVYLSSREGGLTWLLC